MPGGEEDTQGGNEDAPREDEDSPQEEEGVRVPGEEGEGSGSKQKEKYDNTRFLEQRDAIRAAARSGRERLKELAKGAPDKPPSGSRPSGTPTKKPDIKVIFINVTSLSF